MSQQLISIIIPTYNRAHLITQTLDSILAQTYTNWECIIVDDGSTDNTEEIVKTYCAKDTRFQFFKRPMHLPKGPNACRNYGFELSQGDYIKWFDSDDLLREDALKKIIEIPLSNFELQVCNIDFIDIIGKKIFKQHKFESNSIIEDYVLGKITFYTFTPTWNRNFLKKQNELFDEKITNLDDWDFNLRMLYQNPKIVFVNEPLIQYRIHNASLAHEINKLNYNEILSELKAREKHVKLLSKSKIIDSNILKIYIKERCNYFFRESMVKKDANRFKYFTLLLKQQIKTCDYLGIVKTIFAFIIFRVFNKGYQLLK